MGVLPPLGSPYSPISAIVQMARVRANDAGLTIDGELLANDQPYLSRMVNAAWKWLQARAATSGIETYIKEVFISGIPAADTWGNQCFINWQGSGEFNGIEMDGPALPPDLIMPLTVWFMPINSPIYSMAKQSSDGLPTWTDSWQYDWRTDGMYFYGFQNQTLTMRIRYTAAFGDLNIEQDSPVPMFYSDDCLAWRIVYEFANARGGAQAPMLQQAADDAFDTFAQRTGRKNQRRTLRRLAYAGGGCYTGF